jgi:hypothetical protein
MSAAIRPATAADVDAIAALKQSLALDGQSGARGGFLLGCSRERYALLVAHAHVLVLEENGALTGFAITLPDPLLRASELWSRRALIRWHANESEPPEHAAIAYFDQLALARTASRLHAPALALAAVRQLIKSGHQHLYATLLHAPFRNHASLPLLRAAGARAVAFVPETYPQVGPIVSELHHLRLDSALAARAAAPLGTRLALSAERLAA